MVSLYNMRHSGDQFRCSKFDEHFNLEASYLLDAEFCECPAGVRPKCRHREMLPKFIKRDAIGSNWFFDYDRGGWVQGEALLNELASAASTPPSIATDEGGPIPSPSEPIYEEPEGLDEGEEIEGIDNNLYITDEPHLSEATPLDTKPEASPLPDDYPFIWLNPIQYSTLKQRGDDMRFYKIIKRMPVSPAIPTIRRRV